MHQIRGGALLRRWSTTILVLVVSLPLSAQVTSEDRLAELEVRLEALLDTAEDLRSEIARLRAEMGIPDATEEGEDDLLDVEPIEPEELVVEDLSSTITAAPISIGSASTSQTMFNPQISVIGNIVAFAGDSAGDERESFALEEAELAFEAYVDPYAKAKFYVGFGHEGAEVEEGYIQFINLPADFAVKAGKLKASFGKFNSTHFHTWAAIDKPLVHSTFFGEEGIVDSGVSVSRIFPSESGLFELIGEAYRGEVEEVFEPADRSDLMVLGRARYYTDLSDSANIEVGGNWLRGHLPEGGTGEFYGTDLTYRWKPLARSIYRSFIGRAELIWNDREDQADTAFGYFGEASYQFARRWIAGARIDRVDRPDDPTATDEGGAIFLTFRPSEFSLFRGEYRQVDFAEGFDSSEILFQIQFGIGAHGAHPF